MGDVIVPSSITELTNAIRQRYETAEILEQELEVSKQAHARVHNEREEMSNLLRIADEDRKRLDARTKVLDLEIKKKEQRLQILEKEKRETRKRMTTSEMELNARMEERERTVSETLSKLEMLSLHTKESSASLSE